MRFVRLAVAGLTAMAAGASLAAGCQDATQATLDIRLLKNDLCPALGGTALSVGADRDEVETRMSSYVTAETRACDQANGNIGSLVITPGESGRSAIVVVVAFDQTRARTAADCKPPAFAGCVVARRYFAFSEHEDLRIPITIDPACVDVPCNATSTCRKGNCYESTTIRGEEPGDDGRGGALEAGIVDGTSDGFVADGALTDASRVDSGDGSTLDGNVNEGGIDASSTIPFCGPESTPVLYCAPGPSACGGGLSCCRDMSGSGTPFCGAGCQAGSEPRCCKHEDCPASMCCPSPGADPTATRRCVAGGVLDDAGKVIMKLGCP